MNFSVTYSEQPPGIHDDSRQRVLNDGSFKNCCSTGISPNLSGNASVQALVLIRAERWHGDGRENAAVLCQIRRVGDILVRAGNVPAVGVAIKHNIPPAKPGRDCVRRLNDVMLGAADPVPLLERAIRPAF